jgi:predicted membrane protein
MELLNLTSDMSVLGFFKTANGIASDGLFMVITLILFIVILFYTMSRADIGRSVAIASFVSIMTSIFFVAMNLMSANLLMLFTVLLIAGILLSVRGGQGSV